MQKISVFVDDKSDNYKLFPENTTLFKVKTDRIQITNRNDLISNAILLSPSDSYILTAFGPLLTTMKSKDLYEAINFAIKNIDFDVLYLTIYGDDCDLISDDNTYENIVFSRTVSPHGTECILIAPQAVNKILDLVKEDEGRGYDFYLNEAADIMKMYRAYPPLMMVDVSRRSKDMQLIKSSVCREQISLAKPMNITKKYTGNMNLFWFFLIVVFILFLAAMVLSFSDKTVQDNNYSQPDGLQNIASSMSQYQRVAS